MSSLLQPPTPSNPAHTLHLSTSAPKHLVSHRDTLTTLLPPQLAVLLTSESQEKWLTHENLFISLLTTQKYDQAYVCLEDLTLRFGRLNERVMALQGLYKEATAQNEEELERVMTEYEEILKEDPTIFSIRKRRAALLRSMGKLPEAVTALTNLLDSSPTDAEAWMELAECYVQQGMYEQAVFSLEEAVVGMPNAWNVQARLGEVLFAWAGVKKEEGGQGLLEESLRRFLRSVELCESYLRGWYGVKVVRWPLF